MPQPTLSSVHVNAALNNVAIGYKPQQYVLDQVFPIIPVMKESDYYFSWDQGPIRMNNAKKVRPGDRAPRGGFTVSSTTYTTDCWKFAWAIPDRIRANMDGAISAEVNTTMRVMDQILLSRESTIATLLTTTANWTNTAAAGGFWDSGLGSPLGEIETANLAVQAATGMPANTVVMSWKVSRALRKHPELLEHLSVMLGTGQRSAGAGPKFATKDVIADMFDIPNIIITPARYNSAVEGQTASYADVMTDTVWVGYVAPAPAIDEPSAGYVFQVKAPMIRTWREDAEEQDVVEGQVNFVAKATLAGAGYTITNVLG